MILSRERGGRNRFADNCEGLEMVEVGGALTVGLES